MDTSEIDRAADILIEARRQHRQIDHLPVSLKLPADAYAIQDAVAHRLGPVAGWKVGAKGPGEHPNCAPLLSPLIYRSPAVVSSARLHMIGIEAEIAFSLGRDIPPRDANVSEAEIAQSIRSVNPAIEIVDTRIADWRNADKLLLLADNQMNGGFVFGPKVTNWRQRRWTEQPVRLAIDGRTVVETIGGNAAGDPGWLVAWLIDHCARHRGGMRAGSFITTGSCTGLIFVEPGTVIEAEFSGLGAVSVTFPVRG